MNITELRQLNTAQLLSLKDLIDEVLYENYDKKENFFLHDSLDDYIYIIDYKDGHYRYEVIGSKAYNEFNKAEDAIAIRRKTKDLFPTYENLMEKKYDA